jgi:hypothetical protein
MRVRTFLLASASESVFTGAMDGVGIIGDRTGITIGLLMTTIATTPEAARFTTETITTEGAMPAVEVTATAVGSPATAAEIVAAPMRGTGLPMHAVGAGKTAPVLHPSLLKETTGRLEDMRNPAVRAERARAPSAVTTMAERQGALPRAAAPAWAAEREAEEDFRAAVVEVAGTTNQSFAVFLAICKI